MDPALALPEEVEQRVLALLFGRGADQDPDAGIRQLCAARPAFAPAVERLVQHLRAQVADMQRRLGSVWQLSHSEGRYELIEELGRGGLGTVSIARDRMLGRRVALKTIHPRHGERLHEIEPIKVHRFLDEAQIAAQLLHPHIPLVHDLGIGKGGVPYYTMRYVRGQTLGGWMAGDDGQGRSLVATARVLLHVAEALAYAHGRQVLHRDVKPANVLVGRFGEVCVIDWGLARAMPAGSSDGPDGMVSIDRKVDLLSGGLGPVGYVAPEQWRGEFHPASDVFSLAAILHQALLGMPPTIGSQQSHYELSRTAWRRDRRLAAICQRGVAPRLEDRYPTMAALVSDLQHYLADRVPAACRATVPVVAQLLWRRSKRWVGGLVRSLPAFGPVGAAPRTASLTATAGPREPMPGAGAERQRELAARAATVAMPTQFTLASILPASLDRLASLLDRQAAGRDEPQTPGRLAFLAERLDAIRRLSTPMQRFQRPATFASGGMAVVLRMEDSLLRRQVAVKTLRALPDAGVWSSRILDEAQIAAQLDHPSILTVHEIGVDGDGQVRMVMPLVQGGQIDQFLRHRRHEWWITARLLLQIAWGLAFAHQKGVLHRDVKPANIVLGEHGDAYLADWGIALLIGAPGEAESRLRLHRGPGIDEQGTEETVSEETAGAQLTTTFDGMVVGTPSYMAPESFDGTANVGPHSDVWSLGVILYELLAGRHPYLEQLPRGRWDEMGQFLMSARIPPLRQLAPKVPRGLAAVCARAMQPDPVDRFRDAGAFARALEAVVR